MTPIGDVRTKQWEEPHPGRRMSLPTDASMSWGTSVGEGRGGMAAEGRGPYHNLMYARRTSVGGSIGRRGRLRTMPSHLVISESAHDANPEIRTAPLPWHGTERPGKITFNQNVFNGATISETAGDSSDATDATDATDADSDAETGTLVPPATGTTAAFDPSPQGLQLTDFSNHLGEPMDVDETGHGSPALSNSDGDVFRRMSPDEDMYGWDAVLNQKQTSPYGDSATLNAPHQHRLARRSKRNLLHRVFSPGSTSPRDAPPTNSPTSSTWTDSSM